MSRALLKKSLAFVKREAEKRSDGEEKGGSKKKSVSFQRERKVEGDGREGKKRKKQKTVDCITPTATEGKSISSLLNVSRVPLQFAVSSVSEQNLLYFRKRKLISTRTIKNVSVLLCMLRMGVASLSGCGSHRWCSTVAREELWQRLHPPTRDHHTTHGEAGRDALRQRERQNEENNLVSLTYPV